jgi:hypothetical protein
MGVGLWAQGAKRNLHLESGGPSRDKRLGVDGDVEIDACLGRGGQCDAITCLEAEE